ncbi:unnamed protein product [Ceutorhynchus assimilis]|uniref:DUF4806 domain-containing protein n=1 Tax=Ceutorhynchus assimilis TaxID=467358 RepID=A0A9N9MZK2_9CUCU|nr:unnamed protein product [Ceutorhynchus assimilis]
MWKFLNESKLKHVSKPEEFPILPVDRKADFQKLEELLLDEPMHTYLKNRLACIGGLNVRTTVMGMLKLIKITNRLATKFNWAGQNKKAFKATKLKDVIYEATELCFSSGNGKPSDMNDKVINQAMKDWLRLAAQRKTI